MRGRGRPAESQSGQKKPTRGRVAQRSLHTSVAFLYKRETVVRKHIVPSLCSAKAFLATLVLSLQWSWPGCLKPPSWGCQRESVVHCAALAKPSPTAISDHSSGEPGKMPLQPAVATGKQAGRCSLPLSPGTCAQNGRRGTSAVAGLPNTLLVPLCRGSSQLLRHG